MKTKYIAGVALLAWLGVAGWLASMVIAKPAVLRLGNQAEETAEMAQLRSRIARNREVMESVAVLRGGSAVLTAGGPLLALPVTYVAPPTAGTSSTGFTAAQRAGMGVAGVPPVDLGEPVLSLVMVADGRRSAVVNGEHVRTGARLANGGRVVAIGPDWVRIDDAAGERHTYRVRDPLAPQTGGAPR